MTSPATPTASLTAKGEATRDAVLASAIECFGRDGFRRTSVAAIARAAEVGGTVPYAYFDDKEDLFYEALDEDAAATIHECLPLVFDEEIGMWREQLLLAMVAAVQRHPLAHRVLAGQEPQVVQRVFELPAIVDLRSAVLARLTNERAEGHVRTDVDLESVSSGVVTLMLSLLMSIVQLGPDTLSAGRVRDVSAVFEAALEPLAPPA